MLHHIFKNVVSILLLFASTIRASDTPPYCNIGKLDIVTVENPYIKEVEAQINQKDPQNTLDFTITVKEEIPEDKLITKISTSIDDQQTGSFEKDLCEFFGDEDITKYGVDDFPTSCPISPGEHKVINFEVNREKLRGLPDGKFQGSILIMDQDSSQESDAYVTIDFED